MVPAPTELISEWRTHCRASAESLGGRSDAQSTGWAPLCPIRAVPLWLGGSPGSGGSEPETSSALPMAPEASNAFPTSTEK